MKYLSYIFIFLLPAKQPSANGIWQQPTTPAKEISGATNPELIPDDQALSSLFSRIGDDKGGPSWDSRIAFLRESGLSESKCEVVLNSANLYLSAFRAAQFRMESAMKAKIPTQEKRLLYEKDSEDLNRLWRDVTESMAADLGKEDFNRLRAFIHRRIKPNMTLVIPK